MGSRPGLRYIVLKRLDSLMAIHSSRHQAKQAIRAASDEKQWSISTGKIHSYTTRTVYQQQILAFVNWAVETYQVTKAADLDLHADEWVSHYLRLGITHGKSPSTLSTQRSALRMYFGSTVGASVVLPKRTHTTITRSRGAVKQDRHFQPEHWPEHRVFALATGLRRAEMRDLRVRHITPMEDGTVIVSVLRGKGGKARDVEVLAGYEAEILALIAGRDPNERVFARMPKNMDIQSYRRASAQARYQQQSGGRALPPVNRRLKATDYDEAAVQDVAASLGHNRRRTSIVLDHYLR